MTFTCDRCQGDYQVQAGSAVGRVYVKDHRCNHIEATCAHCGATEVIYLGPNRLQAVLQATNVPLTVYAEATSDLRLRAEKAWAAAERRTDRPVDGGHPSPVAQSHAESGDGGTPPGDTLTVYELTRRHEQLLETFADTLSNIPDDLLWDGFHGDDHRRDLPERWTD